MSIQMRIYRALLVVYPTEYRREYGEPMTQLLVDRLRDEGGGISSVGVWVHVLADLVQTAFAERREAAMKTWKAGWWRTLAPPLSVFVAVAGVGLPFEPQVTAGPHWRRGAILYAAATIAGLGLVISGMFVRRRRRRVGSTMIAVGVTPGFPMAIMFWYPPVALIGLLSIALSVAALIDAPKAPQSLVEIAR